MQNLKTHSAAFASIAMFLRPNQEYFYTFENWLIVWKKVFGGTHVYQWGKFQICTIIKDFFLNFQID